MSQQRIDLEDFDQFRERMHERIQDEGNLQINRFFSLDSQAYREGALDVKTKELLGLVSSMVLRCDDCITFHLTNAVEEGATNEELFETFNIALVIGGSIVIPHLRRATDTLDRLREPNPE